MASFSIQNKLTGHVIDIQGNSTNDGALLDAFHAKSGPGEDPANQLWEFSPDPGGSGYFFIKNPHTHHVIDVQHASTLDGAFLCAFHEKSGHGEDPANQLWRLLPDPAGSGYCFIQNLRSGHVIEIRHNSMADGASLRAFPLKLFDNANQLWTPLSGEFPPVVTMAQPPTHLGSGNQYVLSHGGTRGVAIMDIKVTIDIVEEIVADSFGVQVNGFSPKGDNTVDWQQYGVQMAPGSNQLVLFANNWPAPINPKNWLFVVNSPPFFSLPGNKIPAGHKIVIELTNQADGTVTGVAGKVYDLLGTLLATQEITLIGQPLRLGGTVSQGDLAPLVVFQVVLVGYANSAHAQLTAGMGTIVCQSKTHITPSVGYPPYSDGANGTAETSNCFYGQMPAEPSLTILQPFGVPQPVVTGIFGVSEFEVTGRGFFPNDQLTLSYGLFGGGSGYDENGTTTCTAANDGSFSCVVEPPGFPGPEFAPGTVVTFNVMVRDQHGDYAGAGCELDAQGRIENFHRGDSAPGSPT